MMKKNHLNIAIDGPGGAGKSTAAKLLAGRLCISYLDTGAMYRAAALFATARGVDPCDCAGVEAILGGIDIGIEYRDGAQTVLLCGRDVSVDIRKNEMSKAASDISAHVPVRLKLVEMQRKIAAAQSAVLDGRDIGTYVLPDADFKFYLTASSTVRARRRFDELAARGTEVDFDKLLAEIEQRDYNDMHRGFAPLAVAEDAIVVDSSEMSIDEVLSVMMKYIGEKGHA